MGGGGNLGDGDEDYVPLLCRTQFASALFHRVTDDLVEGGLYNLSQVVPRKTNVGGSGKGAEQGGGKGSAPLSNPVFYLQPHLSQRGPPHMSFLLCCRGGSRMRGAPSTSTLMPSLRFST